MKKKKLKRCCFLDKFRVLTFLFFSLTVASVALAGEWRVAPIRLEFDARAKSGLITVFNEGDEKINFQVKAAEWTQDAEGKDQYQDTREVIFFPRIMALDKKGERVIRAGIRIPATTREKTYRLFIEEIPAPQKGEGTIVAINIRFGVPVFVKPLKEDPKGAIEKTELSKSVLNMALKNTGNVHLVINSIDVKGKNAKGEETFSKELSGWYLLSGVKRLYTMPIPEALCKETSGLEIEVKTDRLKLSGRLDVNQEMCLP
jgi:fimbrial chaperone protein